MNLPPDLPRAAAAARQLPPVAPIYDRGHQSGPQNCDYTPASPET